MAPVVYVLISLYWWFTPNVYCWNRNNPELDQSENKFDGCPNPHVSLYSIHYSDILDYMNKHVSRDRSATQPIILWWDGFTGDQGSLKSCDLGDCFFTVNRTFWRTGEAKMLLFYGSDFNHLDLPLPRKSSDQWALLHEESPQNVHMFSHKDAIQLFNYTSTFKRESDFPITTQYLHSIADLESMNYMVPLAHKNVLRRNGLALVSYVQSDCGAQSDRDHFVQMLQRHLAVDCYGQCLHNKDLPEHLQSPLKGMDHVDFYKHQAQYKFILAMENAVCDDYLTEKFWRPFILGSVPIVWGSPKVKDFQPTKHSTITINDFDNVEDIAKLLIYLDKNDSAYEEYLSHKYTGVTNQKLIDIMAKRPWAIGDTWMQDKPHYIDAYQCFLCNQLHKQQGLDNLPIKMAHQDHYGCQEPEKFSDNPPGQLLMVKNSWWSSAWNTGYFMAKALRYFVDKGLPDYTEDQFMDKTMEFHNNFPKT